MLVELQRFVEFGDDWFKHEPRRREDMVFEPVTINTEYVSSVRRYPISDRFEFCEVRMVDWNSIFIFDKTYEEMRALLKQECGFGPRQG